MKRISVIFIMLLSALGTMASGRKGEVAQNPQGQRIIVRADTVSSYIMMPRGVSAVTHDRRFADEVAKLFKVLEQPSCELLRVIVEGSASPDGLWGNNIALSYDRTANAAAYMRSVMGVPSFKIQKKDRMEDWTRLEKMVEASELPCKAEVLDIIRTKTWGERKTALKNVGDGVVWPILEDHYFPQLRCVKVSLVYAGAPKVEKPAAPEQKIERVVVRDTIYVRDTVYVVKEQELQEPEVVQMLDQDVEAQMDTQWMAGIKTNLMSDALLVPSFGIELQLAKHLSLDVAGWWTESNILVLADNSARFAGLSPELRWWLGDSIMRKGSFLGVHGSFAWYTLQGRDGLLYSVSTDPAWSAGLTYGYSLGLGKKARWGLEFMVGAGYISAGQDVSQKNEQGHWQVREHQIIKGIALTKAGVNLTYRFSLR